MSYATRSEAAFVMRYPVRPSVVSLKALGLGLAPLSVTGGPTVEVLDGLAVVRPLAPVFEGNESVKGGETIARCEVWLDESGSWVVAHFDDAGNRLDC